MSLKMLINAGVDVNSDLAELNKMILMWSIEYFDDPEFVEFLLEEAASPEGVGRVEGNSSMKALHQAVFNENLEIIKLLIEDYDADVDAVLIEGDEKIPLMIAAEIGSEEIVNYLLDEVADGSIEYEGKTAYDYFKENEELEDTETYWRLQDFQYK